MKTLVKQVQKLNKNELKELREIITERENEIKSQELKLKIIPDIFKNKIICLDFCTDYHGGGYDDYNNISSWACIEFDNGLKIDANYSISRSRDWNTEKVEIKLNMEVTPLYYKRIRQKFNKYPNAVILELDKKFLKILDESKLKHNTYNKKMLGILINNIISQTQTTCDDENDSYEINIIDIDEINKLNNDKSLRYDKYMIPNDYDNTSIRFKFIDKTIDN
ncbi:hypothetical protein CE11_00060 [Megavirus courdo11]|uniref:Uncharacterized protein n=1 Tax=Megavirus courdo11 TaxID=1128140 RepID=K7YE52_9VIRU|nr:hypothetical protein CE11_00060 [Megavirus courdo11]